MKTEEKKMKKIIVYFIFVGMYSSALFAQLWPKGELTQNNWNTSLKKIKVGDVLEQEYYSCFGGEYDAVLASSWLKAEGNPPKKLKEGEPDADGNYWSGDELDWYNYYNYCTWTEMYGPGRCFDGKTDTAWCEGADGDGIGEVVIVWVDVKRPVRIWTGFGKNENLWKANNRPKDVEVFIISGETVGWSVNGPNFKMTVIGEKKLTLKDINGWQKLDLDEYKEVADDTYQKLDTYDLGKAGTFVGIKILSVYPGTKYHDTLITEISN